MMNKPELIYCAGGNAKFAEIAVKHGFTYGSQLPATVYQPVKFADQNWKDPDFNAYMTALALHKPRIATVLDYDDNTTLDEVLRWAEAASLHVSEAIIIIPKISGTVPSIPHCINGISVRLGYSVPTQFGGTPVPYWEFFGRPVHLLGGSPKEQLKISGLAGMCIASVDGNYLQKMAIQYKQWFANGTARYANNRFYPRLDDVYQDVSEDGMYMAFELSCMNLQVAWSGASVTIRFAIENDIDAIKRIANQYKNELGFVSSASLKTGIKRRSLLVAEYNGYIVGFCNYWARRDGTQTIYEIAVDKSRQGEGIGRAFIAAIPKPIQLKCTVDNKANQFYDRLGFRLTETVEGRKRPLNVWKLTK